VNTPSSRGILVVFAIFAAGYLLSSLLRGVTAALAPVFIAEFHTNPAELGLLAGAYFASFALLQLPMGAWIDKYGARIILIVSLSIAAASCFLFSAAGSFLGLVGARVLSGVGVSACLIAPLTAARLWTTPSDQQQINAWMLMSGALGLVLGTLPAESIATSMGWRPLFGVVGGLFAFVAILVTLLSPKQAIKPSTAKGLMSGYRAILKNPYTASIGPMGLFNYSILVAVQTLWVGPWLTTLGGLTAREAATKLMYINGIMLIVFFVMGYVSPKINKSAEDGERILRSWTPLSITLLFLIAYFGTDASWLLFAVYCVVAWPLSVTHPLVGQRFPTNEAGKAIAFFNLLLFAGVFFWQWGFGVVVTKLHPVVGTVNAYRISMLLLAILSLAGYLAFLLTVQRAKIFAIAGIQARQA
jgi:MFS family permease